MKRCPECDSSYADSDLFCDLDGRLLVTDYPESSNPSAEPETLDPRVAGAGSYPVPGGQTLRENWGVLAVLAFAVVALVIVLFVGYQQMTFKAPGENSNTPAAADSLAGQQLVPPPVRPSPSVSESPSPEPSPSPSAMPTPGLQTESTRLAVSSSPVSTGGGDKTKPGQVTIRLTNGTTVEAEEVWETGEGIWYRRRGLVTLLERKEVQAIERPTPAASSPEVTPKP